MNELKKRVFDKEKEEGKTKLSQKPAYWSEAFWRDLVNYWETNEGHLHRAKVGATNRQRVERLHSAGARSFNAVKNVIKSKYAQTHTHAHTRLFHITNMRYFIIWKELAKTLQKPPTKLEVWDKCHKKVGSDPEHPVYTTPAAMRIAVILFGVHYYKHVFVFLYN
jgi:hypothetical protein